MTSQGTTVQSLRSADVFKEREEQEYPMRVYLRIRPLSRYEVSRRSRNCILVHPDDMNGTTRVTIDSPYEGQYDFSFDQIFDENSKQQHVYESVARPLVQKVIAGYNCTILMYGSSQSGRTYTMMGMQHQLRVKGEDTLVKNGDPTSVVDQEDSAKEVNEETALSHQKNNARDDSNKIDENSGIIHHFIHDLFQSISQIDSSIQLTVHCTYVEVYMEAVRDLLNSGPTYIKITDAVHSGTRLEGLSKIRCKNEIDIASLLARGNAIRTILDSRKQTDIRHSHAIFTLNLEQKCTSSGRTITSCIHFVDMAASDLANKPYPNKYNKVMNASSSALNAVVRSLTDGGTSDIPYKNSVLTQILKSALGGNCISCVVCTVTPASLTVEDTLACARFGEKCKGIRNLALKNIFFSPEEGLLMLQDFVKRGQAQSTKPLLDMDNRDRGTDTIESTLFLQSQLDNLHQIKENMNNDILGLQSEVLILRHENDCLLAEKKKAVEDLVTTQNEMQELQRRKTEVENNLRTSQFRESEATSFLRQFRIFYRRLLQSKSSQGTSFSSQLFAQPPGIPGIQDMVDVDTLLWRSGLLEDDEVDSDGKVSSKYRPSAQALTRSSIAAANHDSPSEILRSHDFEFLQLELNAVVEKSYALNVALQEAQATIELLSSNNGSLAKIRLAEEALSLKKVLLEKESDLQAVIWKMNELNLVNKTYDKKMSNMVEHMNYLTEAVDVVQEEYRNALDSNRKTIKKLQDDIQHLSSLVHSLTMRNEENGNQIDNSEFFPENATDISIRGSRQSNHSIEIPCEETSLSEIQVTGVQRDINDTDDDFDVNVLHRTDIEELKGEYTNELDFKQMIRNWAQYPDETVNVGAKLNSYVPIRFTVKFGPQIRLGTFQDYIRLVKC